MSDQEKNIQDLCETVLIMISHPIHDYLRIFSRILAIISAVIGNCTLFLCNFNDLVHTYELSSYAKECELLCSHREVVKITFLLRGVVVQSPSHIWFCTTPWTAACQYSLSPDEYKPIKNLSWRILHTKAMIYWPTYDWAFLGFSEVKNVPSLQETQEMWVWPLDQEGPPEKEMQRTSVLCAFLVAQMVKNLRTMQETQVQFPREDPLE